MASDSLQEAQAESFEDFSSKACRYLQQQQRRCDSTYHFSQYDNWYYDQGTGELTFSDKGLPTLVVDYEEVGSISSKSNTWLWAWDNPDVEAKVKSRISQVRQFGAANGFKQLTEPYWPANQTDGWNMTAAAAYLMQAKGAYRVPIEDEQLFVFMIFKAIRIEKAAKRAGGQQ